MDPRNKLELGNSYNKKDLAILLDEAGLNTVREGVFTCKQSASYLLFVDLEKEGKEERFHFNDFFEENFFHWDSQTTQHINSPRIQSLVTQELNVFLFVRVQQKIRRVTQPFIFCGELRYLEHDPATEKPVHIIFENIDYDDFTENEALVDIYLWKPEKVGRSSSTNISKKGVVSETRIRSYKKPNITERSGLVTSRVGQGYFKSQLLEKYHSQCAITKVTTRGILIASHIVPWSEASDEERLDVNNGILLSPLYDALFDKHLIAFDDSGGIIISPIIENEVDKLHVDRGASIAVNDEMRPYLKRHRDKLR